jgi:hypothetical protein
MLRIDLALNRGLGRDFAFALLGRADFARLSGERRRLGFIGLDRARVIIWGMLGSGCACLAELLGSVPAEYLEPVAPRNQQ